MYMYEYLVDVSDSSFLVIFRCSFSSQPLYVPLFFVIVPPGEPKRSEEVDEDGFKVL